MSTRSSSDQAYNVPGITRNSWTRRYAAVINLPDQQGERALIQDVLTGKVGALERLFETYGLWLRLRACRTFNNNQRVLQELDDLLQDFWMWMSRTGKTRLAEVRSSLKNWLWAWFFNKHCIAYAKRNAPLTRAVAFIDQLTPLGERGAFEPARTRSDQSVINAVEDIIREDFSLARDPAIDDPARIYAPPQVRLLLVRWDWFIVGLSRVEELTPWTPAEEQAPLAKNKPTLGDAWAAIRPILASWEEHPPQTEDDTAQSRAPTADLLEILGVSRTTWDTTWVGGRRQKVLEYMRGQRRRHPVWRRLAEDATSEGSVSWSRGFVLYWWNHGGAAPEEATPCPN
jgi:hypothetical protein